MSVHEFGSFGSNQDVTGEGNFESSSDGESSDGSDYRFAAPLHLHDGVGLRILHIALEYILRRREVHARTERTTRPGQYYNPGRAVPVQALESVGQVHHHRAGQRVEGIGAIDRHRRDAVWLAGYEYQLLMRQPIHVRPESILSGSMGIIWILNALHRYRGGRC